MSDARLFASATILVVASSALLLTIAWYDAMPILPVVVPWLRLTVLIYGAIFFVPLILASTKVMSRRTAALVGVVALASIFAALLYVGQTGPLECPSGHCPDPGSAEDVASRARRAASRFSEAMMGFAVCLVAGAFAHGLAWLGGKFARR